MEKEETVSIFFSKISDKNQLMAIGDKVEDDDLVHKVFNGLLASWETFLAAVNGREVQTNFEILWHDCLEEEGRIQSRSGPPPKKDHALDAKAMKGKNIPQHKDNGKEPQGKYFHKSKLGVIIVVRLVIMQGIVRNQLTRIGIGRNIIPQLLRKKNNLRQRN